MTMVISLDTNTIKFSLGSRPSLEDLIIPDDHTEEISLQLWMEIQFPHIGLTQRTPESITSAELREPHNPKFSEQVEEKLPAIYKVREKQAVNNSFPFSVHDNRHSFQNSGYFFDSGMGRKKISPEKRQHVSRNFNLWASDYVPSCLDGFSNNQISYVCQDAAVVPIFRRFPRRYNEIWSTFKFIPQQSYTETFKKCPKVRFTVDKKADSPPEP